MVTGLSGAPALINMHYNLAQGAKLKGYPISRRKAPLGMRERHSWRSLIPSVGGAGARSSKLSQRYWFCFGGGVGFLPSLKLPDQSLFIFFCHTSKIPLPPLPPFLLEHAQERGSPLYRSQTHFYSSGYLYGNEGQRVSFYFIFLRLLITTARRRRRRNTSCVSR